jgi:hypothetical protein
MSKITTLSWGCGLQSSCLLEMSASGDYGIPKLDAAIFSDTGFEHLYTYDVFEFYAPLAFKAGIKVIKIGEQDILKDTYKHVSLPMFVSTTGRQITRKCTRDYKIRPIQRVVRDLLGVNRRGRLAADLVTLWLGITTDEIHRAKDSRVSFIKHEFPLLDLRFKRGDCADYLKSKGLLVPKKSSCIFCPFKSRGEWHILKKENNDQFLALADLEKHIYDKGLVKIDGQVKKMSFVRDGSLLAADFENRQLGLFDEMCEGGFCHV